jgi:hypothetical protein
LKRVVTNAETTLHVPIERKWKEKVDGAESQIHHKYYIIRVAQTLLYCRTTE